MKYKITIGFLSLVAIFSSCNPANTNLVSLSAEEQEILLQKGDSIATKAQQILLANVSAAMQEKGIEGAIYFCNTQAMPLTDSVASSYQTKIQRLSDKNRNPDNALTQELDRKIWGNLKTMLQDESIQQKHVLAENQGNVYYYKPIQLGLPTCLACHGNKETDIPPQALTAIHANYPNDKATGYQLGELRGMWKIKLEN